MPDWSMLALTEATRRFFSLLLLLTGLLTFGSFGCAGSVRPDFYSPTTSESDRKLPFSVAIVNDPTLMTQQFKLGANKIELQPGVFNAIKAELASIFKTVDVVPNPREARKEDLLAVPTFEISGSHPNYIVRIKIRLKDIRSSEQVVSFEHAEQFNYEDPPGARLGQALIFGSAFLLTPIAIPVAATSIVEYLQEQFEEIVPRSLRSIGEDIRGDRRLLAYVPGTISPPALAATGPRAPTLVFAPSDVDSPPSLKTSNRKGGYAIVVGLESYRSQLPKADFASRDAQVIATYLTKALGYPEEHVVVLLNDRAAKSDIDKYVDGWLPNRVEPGDTVFFYYSGHGAPNPKTGDAYMVPYDGDPAFLDATGYPLKRLYEHLAKLPAKEVVVVLDTCFSGAGGRSVLAKGMRPVVVSVENPVLASGKTVVLTASGGDQVSSTYEQKGHGLLTYFFLKGLQGEADQNKDGNIDLSEVFAYLKPQVERVARREFNNEQTPQLLGSPELLNRGILLLEQASR